MTDHITEKKVESEGKVFNKNRGKTVSKSKVFEKGASVTRVANWMWEFVGELETGGIDSKYTLTITKHLD